MIFLTSIRNFDVATGTRCKDGKPYSNREHISQTQTEQRFSRMAGLSLSIRAKQSRKYIWTTWPYPNGCRPYRGLQRHVHLCLCSLTKTKTSKFHITGLCGVSTAGYWCFFPTNNCLSKKRFRVNTSSGASLVSGRYEIAVMLTLQTKIYHESLYFKHGPENVWPR